MSQQSVRCVFRCTAPAVHFFVLGGDTVDLNYFKDILFDLVNESDKLEPDLMDIQCDDKNNVMTVIMNSGDRFVIKVSKADE